MKKYRCLYAICLAAVGLMTACSQEELTDGDALPEGLYPVEIASVSIGGESSAQPWGAHSPQTRMYDGADGETSYWDTGEQFFLKFEGGEAVGIYEWALGGSSGYLKDPLPNPLYWRSATQEERLIGWFTQPATTEDGTLDISNQKEQRAYVCRSETTAKYGSGVNLDFHHQLAKVQVWVQGTGYEGNGIVSINNVPTACTVTEGEITGQPISTGSITMHKTTVNNAACFEANLLPGSTLEKFSVSLGDNPSKEIILNNKLEKLDRGKYYTVNLRLQKENTQIIDLSTGDREITGDGLYFFTGTGTHSIKVKSGNPKIYLANADISVASGHAIEVSGGSPTFVIQGSTEVQASTGAGIYVTSGSITIKSDRGNDKNSRLTARGGSDGTNVYPGIGGGEGIILNFKDLYIYAHGSAKDGNYSPGIGASQPLAGNSPDAPTVNVTGCYVYAYRVALDNGQYWRDSYAQHIGQGGNATTNRGGDPNSASINLNGGSQSNSMIYGYTGDYQNGFTYQ